ncbi:MAG: insulinase family protein [Candidatus Omnitrophica bacterium]|nr:insulinase family protein [Candidatus Omnitrophota bacterium]
MKSPYQFATLKNGLGLVQRPMPNALSTAVGIWVRAGGRYESKRHAGISHFLEHLLFKGTRRRSCEALKQAIEGVGGSLNGFTAEEFTCYMAKVPARFTRRAVDVLTDMIRHPTLRPNDVEKEREVIVEEIRMYEDAPGQYVHDLLSALLWPNHPLGTLLSGTMDSVRRIRRSDVVRYWRGMYQPRNIVVSCVGAAEPSVIARHVGQTLGAMTPRPSARFRRAPRVRFGPQVRLWKKDTEQTHLCLGTYAVPRTHPDRFAMELLHVVLGANMSSRLFREVREKRGLVYEIGSQIKRFEDTGAFIIYAGCDTKKLHATMQTIMTELSRIRRTPIGPTELRRAKDYYAGQLLMGLEDTMDHMLWMGEQAAMVGRVAQPEKLLAHLEQVTARDIQRVARHLFTTPKIHLVVGGPIAETETPQLANLCRIG